MREKWLFAGILFVIHLLSPTFIHATPEIVLAENGKAQFEIVLLLMW